MHGKILQPKEEDDTPKLGREGKAPIPEEKKTRRGLFRSPSAPMGLRRCATMDGSFSPTSSPFIFAPSGSAKKRRPAPDMHVKPKRHRSDDAADFDHAYAAEARARALAALGRVDEARAAYAEAAATPIAHEQDREIFEADFAAGPWFGLEPA